MRQQQFEELNHPLWVEMRALLDDLARFSGRQRLDPVARGRLPWLYRQLCNHYALARSRHYSPTLVAELHDMVLQGHRQLYRRRSAMLWRAIGFVSAEFPRALRAHASYLWLAIALFALPGLLTGLLCYQDPELIYSLLGEADVAQMEEMYDPANRKVGRTEERGSETDFAMFGFYINHNISIGFRTFAGGILFGAGTLFNLLFNGLVLGGVSGHLTRIGYTETFWPFVSGHGAFELTAIAICGAAGLMIAHPLIHPGRRTRVEALKRQAAEALKLVMGAAWMLLIAAFIEAFWSSSGFAPVVKYIVAAGLWTLVLLYLGFAGGGRGAR